MGMEDVQSVGRTLAVIALLSERFDMLVGSSRDADEAALHVARSILSMLKPFAATEAANDIRELATHYGE